MAQGIDDGLKIAALLAEFLRAFGVIPDCGVFQQLRDFGQTLLFDLVVKDTPEDRCCASGGR